MKQQAPWDPLEGIEKIRKYCAYQERCRSDVYLKLLRLNCPKEEIDALIGKMEDEGFLDEGRYARSYVRGHYAIKGWGRIKIQNALREKRIPESAISKAMTEIDAQKYYEKLLEIAYRKSQQTDLTDWDKRQKFKAWLLGRGFEYEQIELAIEDLIAGNY